jgi:hypothetical protein
MLKDASCLRTDRLTSSTLTDDDGEIFLEIYYKGHFIMNIAIVGMYMIEQSLLT